MILLRTFLVVWTVALAFAGTEALAQQLAPAPEASTGRTAKSLGTARKYMVAAANPLAAEAGREMLRAGGSAVDAAIAVQLVLNLVEPQSSGIGGGAFLVHWSDAGRGSLRRSTAARRRPPRRSPTGSSAGTASRCRSSRRWSAAARSAFPAPCGSSRRRIRAGASCLGRGCSSRRSALPTRALRSRRASAAFSRKRRR